MTRVLVTGAGGFIGKNLVNSLLKNDYFVISCSSKENQNTHINRKDIKINITEKTNWEKFVNDVDVVVHCAARVHQINSINDDDKFINDNFLITKNLFDFCVKFKIKKFIFISTIKVIGEFSSFGVPFDENTKLNPKGAYAKSKLMSENYLLNSKFKDIQVIIIRPPLVYGNGVKANFLKLIEIINDKRILPFGMLNDNKRSLIYIENLVDIIIKFISHKSYINDVFLVSDDKDLSTYELMKNISQSLNKNTIFLKIPKFILLIIFIFLGKKENFDKISLNLSLNINKLKKSINWNPPYNAYDGLKITCKSYKDE